MHTSLFRLLADSFGISHENGGRLQALTATLALLSATALSAFAQAPGTKLWQFAAGDEIRSSPAIGYDGTIYFGARDNKLYALNPDDGTRKWEFATGGWADASPAVGPDGTIYVGSRDGQLYAVSPSGVKRWSFPTGGPITEPPAIAPDGTIYSASSDGQLYAVGSNGAKKWQLDTGYGALQADYNSAPAPSVASDGSVYVGLYDRAKSRYSICAVNPDATVKWKSDDTGVYFYGSGSSCAIDLDGTIYPAGAFSVALAPDGTQKAQSQLWSSIQPLAIGVGGRLYSSQIVASTPAGTPLWSDYNLSSPTAAAIDADGTVYVGEACNDSPPYCKLHALNGSDGSEQWSFQTNGKIYGAPTIGTNGVVYVGSTDKKLYAVQGSAGPAQSGWPMYRRNAQHTGATRSPTYSNTQLGIAMYPGLLIQGNVGNTYRVEYADALGDTNKWSLLGTVTLDRTPYLLFDVASKNGRNRFYRATLLQ